VAASAICRHHHEARIQFDSSKIAAAFRLTATPYSEGIAATLKA
jgi:hypothetical protein